MQTMSCRRCPENNEFDIRTEPYDPDTYWGRVKRFFYVANPTNLLATDDELERAKAIVLKTRNNEPLPDCFSAEELLRQQVIFETAFNPLTGEKLCPKISAQSFYLSALLTCLMSFYKTTKQVIFWNGIYSTYFALTTHSNRGTNEDIHEALIGLGVIGSVASGIGIGVFFKKLSPKLSKFARAFIPLLAVSLTQIITIRLMRSHELIFGTPVYNEKYKRLTNSIEAAKEGVSQLQISRFAITAPALRTALSSEVEHSMYVLLPVVAPCLMEYISSRGTFCEYPWMTFPMRFLLTNFLLFFSLPLACALYKQKAEMRFCQLEKDAQEDILKKGYNYKRDFSDIVYYHRGLCKEPLYEYISDNEYIRARSLYDSAFNPDTGEKMSWMSRMASQIQYNTLILGTMLTFTETALGVAFWQWAYQLYNHNLYKTNKGGQMSHSEKQLNTQYYLASLAAIGTALGIWRWGKNRCASPMFYRYMPLPAVLAGFVVSVPILKAQELKYGTPIFDDHQRKLGYSKEAAVSAVRYGILYRMALVAPGMLLAPLAVEYFDRLGYVCRYPWIALPINIAVMALCLCLISPFTTAMFNRKGEIKFKHLEPELQNELRRRYNNHPPRYAYFDKGM